MCLLGKLVAARLLLAKVAVELHTPHTQTRTRIHRQTLSHTGVLKFWAIVQLNWQIFDI